MAAYRPLTASSLVMPAPRFERIEARTHEGGLRVRVDEAVYTLGSVGEVHATARFTAVLERTRLDGAAEERTIPSIERATVSLSRDGLGRAGAVLHLAAPALSRLWARLDCPSGEGVTLLRATWSELQVMDSARRLLESVRGDWTVHSLRSGAEPAFA